MTATHEPTVGHLLAGLAALAAAARQAGAPGANHIGVELLAPGQEAPARRPAEPADPVADQAVGARRRSSHRRSGAA